MSGALSALLLATTLVLGSGTALFAAGRAVTLSAADGTSLSALLYEASARPAPGVVLVHMLGRSKDEWASFAERLQDAGVTVLALDLRGHGSSGGNGSLFAAMVGDVRTGAAWLGARPNVRPGAMALIGASLGANLAALAAAEMPAVRGVGLVSPSLDYRGVRLDSAVMKRLSDRALWMAASTEDPYALRTVKDLSASAANVEQRLSRTRAHGTGLLADQEIVLGLVDWLRRTLIF
jgi:alpha-beta hydrolase superfamily lysophospholipase